MQIVIDIPNTDYQVILTKIMLACHGCKITELPKGHGRLIDADDFFQMFEELDMEPYNDAPTIIEADKGRIANES